MFSCCLSHLNNRTHCLFFIAQDGDEGAEQQPLPAQAVPDPSPQPKIGGVAGIHVDDRKRRNRSRTLYSLESGKKDPMALSVLDASLSFHYSQPGVLHFEMDGGD